MGLPLNGGHPPASPSALRPGDKTASESLTLHAQSTTISSIYRRHDARVTRLNHLLHFHWIMEPQSEFHNCCILKSPEPFSRLQYFRSLNHTRSKLKFCCCAFGGAGRPNLGHICNSWTAFAIVLIIRGQIYFLSSHHLPVILQYSFLLPM